ncbi:Enolase-phosphatase E1, partial [Dinochytrium kinnereticum]
AAKDVEDGVEGVVVVLPRDHGDVEEVRGSVVGNVRWQVEKDRKVGALKAFQGFMWRFAYESGKVKGSVFDDVVPVLDLWRSRGIKVYVYSSGSVEAQKLLFGYSDKGDILDRFSGHFDTTIGSKLSPKSYTSIHASIHPPEGRTHLVSSTPKKSSSSSSSSKQSPYPTLLPPTTTTTTTSSKTPAPPSPSTILFLSDNPLEIDAAAEAGFRVAVVRRKGNAEVESGGVGWAVVGEGRRRVRVVESFWEVVREGEVVREL